MSNSLKTLQTLFLLFSLSLQGPFLCELCNEDWKPVCSSRNITYYNKCHAICYLDWKYVDGECLNKCDCLDETKPVCGLNGKTYENACMAVCNGVKIDLRIRGPCACDCDDVFEPVCGMGGVTYVNVCRAACDGVGVVYQGYCK